MSQHRWGSHHLNTNRVMRKGVWYLILYVLLGSFANPAMAISRRHDVADAQYIQLADHYPAVGRWINGFSNGSGVLIAPQWVLMASHNVMFQTKPFAFEVGGELYHADWSKRHFAALPHPYGADFMRDIALVHLDRPVKNVSPAQLYTRRDELGMHATIVGYGLPGDGLHGVPLDGSQVHKRAAQNVIDALGTYDGEDMAPSTTGSLMFYDFDSPGDARQARNWFGGSNIPLPLEGMMTSGDSGGGVFVEMPTGRYLIGINSGVFPGVTAGSSHTYGIVSRTVRVSSFIGWIHDTMRRFESGREPLKGLIGHWDFDDLDEGFAQDVSGVGHRGTVVRASPTEGVMGGAVFFHAPPETFDRPMAEQAYVEVPNATLAWKGVIANDLKIKNDMTIAAWVYRMGSGGPDGVATSEVDTIAAKVPVSDPTPDFAFIFWENRLRLYNRHDYAESPSLHIPQEMWQHIAVTRRGSHVSFYLNGQLLGENTLSEAFPISDNPLIIGNFPESRFGFNGKIDDLRIYKRCLEPQEVEFLSMEN